MLKSALYKLRKAATASPREWWVRGSQLGYDLQIEYLARLGRSCISHNAFRRSLGISPGHPMRDFWQQRNTRPWLDRQRRSSLREMAAQHTAAFRSLFERAIQISSGKMTLFSRPPIEFQRADRWHRDAVLDRTAPESLYTRIPYLDAQRVGDSKHVWEPNRWGWVYPLGAAYVIQNDPAYFDTFQNLAEDWLQHNTYPYGINYCSALEIAFRNYAILWALELFRDVLVDEPGLLEQLLCELWIGCQHIEQHLSYYFAPNTHILGEGFGLYACGLALPEFHESTRWRTAGRQILEKEADRQIHQDGTHRELSACYHLYTTDFYLHAAWLASHYRDPRPDPIEDAARKLVGRLAELTPASGILPQWNDCDGGRLTWFAEQPLDARPSLQFARSRWGWTSTVNTAEPHGWAAWLPMNADDQRTERQAVHSGSETDTRDSGLLVHQNAAHDYVLFRAGPFGYRDCPHSHDGTLGLLLALGGHWILVDSGTGAYTQSLELRNRYRSAHGKNTILVNGSGPSDPTDAFGWKRTTAATTTGVETQDGCFLATAYHDGFGQRFGGRITVERQICLFDHGIAVIVDRWDSDRLIDVTIPWTLAPELTISEEFLLLPTGEKLHFLQAGCDHESTAEAAPDRNGPAVRAGCYSRDYGWDGTTNVLECHQRQTCRGAVISVFSRLGRVATTSTIGQFRVGSGDSQLLLRIALESTEKPSLQRHPYVATE